MRLKEQIEVMTHFDNGGLVQRLDGHILSGDSLEWVDDFSPSWNFGRHQYRKKPKEKVCIYKWAFFVDGSWYESHEFHPDIMNLSGEVRDRFFNGCLMAELEAIRLDTKIEVDEAD